MKGEELRGRRAEGGTNPVKVYKGIQNVRLNLESNLQPIHLDWYIQCNLDLVTLLVSAKTVTKSHNVTKSNDFM